MELSKRRLGNKNFTANGKCSRCGNCCSNKLPLRELDIKRIKQYMRVHKVEEHTVWPDSVLYNIKNTLICPFYDGVNKKCEIYHIRPWICRKFKCDTYVGDFIDENIGEFRQFWEHIKIINMRETFFKKHFLFVKNRER